MERYVGKPLFGKRLFVEPDAFGYVIALFMKDQRNQVVLVLQSVATGLIYEHAKLAHQNLRQKEKPGKTSPALGSPPVTDDQLLYSISQGDWQYLKLLLLAIQFEQRLPQF